ncbi:interleukin-17 receptor D isoform X2 [Lepisosteus oculatus]|uniref:interleukin-17 receptor D isoform X2 n=1 Tax=Lepisosteus oculatus TaxID=7918 RepID=UPI0035F525FF
MAQPLLWSPLLVLLMSGASAQDSPRVVSPQNCTLDCVIQGEPTCEFCRVSREELELQLGVSLPGIFGSCVPLPCHSLLGLHSPAACQHYVHAPHNITVEFMPDRDPAQDIVTVSWMPSQYGNSWDCLPPWVPSLHSDPGRGTSGLPALPFPAQSLSGGHGHPKACAEKIGLEQCHRDWYPRDITVTQEGNDIIVTFNLAPPSLGINRYFSWCSRGGTRNYTEIEVNSLENQTHHSFHLRGLDPGAKYSCEMAADMSDAVRKRFAFQVGHVQQESSPATPSSESLFLVLLPVSAVIALTGSLVVLIDRRTRKRRVRKKAGVLAECVGSERAGGITPSPLPCPRCPPQLLMCYSSADGPAHINAVVRLAAFLQQHMAIQVHLDLWESLRLAEEGVMSWHCRGVQESDFVLVVCSQGLGQLLQGREEEEEEEGVWKGDVSTAVVSLIGEEIGRASLRGQSLSKYISATFEHSRELDIPGVLRLASHYLLPRDLPLLFSHLHGVELCGPGQRLHVQHVSEEGYLTVPAGAALCQAIAEAGGVQAAAGHTPDRRL